MENNLKLSVIMPVYNERNTVEKILVKVAQAEPKDKEIIVVDDGSTDGTREILAKLQNKMNFKLLFNSINSGKGSSFRKGLFNAQGDIVIPQDADLELDPDEYVKLMRPIASGSADVTFGSRLMHLKRPNYQFRTLFVNKLFVWLINLLYKGRYTDILTCYKMCKIDVLKSLNLVSERFDIEPEIACKLLKKRCRIAEIPISYHPRGWDEGKKIKPIDTFSILKTIIKNLLVDRK